MITVQPYVTPPDQIGLLLKLHDAETFPRDRALIARHLSQMDAATGAAERKPCECCICAEKLTAASVPTSTQSDDADRMGAATQPKEGV